jgi:hypothetical protein
MIGSATPCMAELGSRPLRAPLAHSHAQASQAKGEAHRRAYPQIEMQPHLRRPTLPRSLRARLRALAPDDKELGLFLEDLALAVRAESGKGYDLSDADRFEAGLPLEPDAARSAPQAHVRALVQDFRRRQRQASMVVAGCVAASFVLTVVGIAALASFVRPAPADAQPVIKSSNTVVFGENSAPAKLILAKAAPLTERLPVGEQEEPESLAPDLAAASSSSARTPQLIMVQAGRPLEIAPLLPQRQARYVLFRGLPNDATLSAGQRNPSGAWLVKDKDLDRLTLSMARSARGDYPIEVYALGAASAPQARQRFVFRVAAGPTSAAAGGAAGVLFDMALLGVGEQSAATKSSPLMARAMRLLGEGDIAGARLLFMHLAEQGESEAAYELGRTFDGEVLSELGVKGVGPDRTRAVGWYEHASESGNAKATERLKILASLSD